MQCARFSKEPKAFSPKTSKNNHLLSAMYMRHTLNHETKQKPFT
jgi:hypothetical protein